MKNRQLIIISALLVFCLVFSASFAAEARFLGKDLGVTGSLSSFTEDFEDDFDDSTGIFGLNFYLFSSSIQTNNFYGLLSLARSDQIIFSEEEGRSFISIGGLGRSFGGGLLFIDTSVFYSLNSYEPGDGTVRREPSIGFRPRTGIRLAGNNLFGEVGYALVLLPEEDNVFEIEISGGFKFSL